MRMELCTGLDEREDDSPYEADDVRQENSGDVRQENLGDATTFRWRRGAPGVGDTRQAALQQEKKKGEVRCTVNQFHGAWGVGSSRKGKMAALERISVRWRSSGHRRRTCGRGGGGAKRGVLCSLAE
jgi:hypothetical protein